MAQRSTAQRSAAQRSAAQPSPAQPAQPEHSVHAAACSIELWQSNTVYAFLKALIILQCWISTSRLSDEQDVRKMGGSSKNGKCS